MNITKKSLIDCEIVNYWSHSIDIMRSLMKDDGLYLDELFLLSAIYRLRIEKDRPVRNADIQKRFNILSYKRDKMLNNLISRGLINNDMEGPRGHFKPLQLVVSSLGEQLLIKYEKALRRLCNEV